MMPLAAIIPILQDPHRDRFRGGFDDVGGGSGHLWLDSLHPLHIVHLLQRQKLWINLASPFVSIRTRRAVEAGENLGFLPGDLREKLDPYLQPLYDALKDMIPATRLADHLEEGVIQIAPLAFMRGRTLDHAFVILDEAQNATLPQLKMFLTRMGRNAKFVITGDVTQVDLPDRQPSGLMPAVAMLRDVEGINVVELDEKDVIRHALVTKVLIAFRELEAKNPGKDPGKR